MKIYTLYEESGEYSSCTQTPIISSFDYEKLLQICNNANQEMSKINKLKKRNEQTTIDICGVLIYFSKEYSVTFDIKESEFIDKNG